MAPSHFSSPRFRRRSSYARNSWDASPRKEEDSERRISEKGGQLWGDGTIASGPVTLASGEVIVKLPGRRRRPEGGIYLAPEGRISYTIYLLYNSWDRG